MVSLLDSCKFLIFPCRSNGWQWWICPRHIATQTSVLSLLVWTVTLQSISSFLLIKWFHISDLDISSNICSISVSMFTINPYLMTFLLTLEHFQLVPFQYLQLFLDESHEDMTCADVMKQSSSQKFKRSLSLRKLLTVSSRNVDANDVFSPILMHHWCVGPWALHCAYHCSLLSFLEYTHAAAPIYNYHMILCSPLTPCWQFLLPATNSF